MSSLIHPQILANITRRFCGRTNITIVIAPQQYEPLCTKYFRPNQPPEYIVSMPADLSHAPEDTPYSTVENPYLRYLFVFLHELGHTQTSGQLLPNNTHYNQPRERAATEWAVAHLQEGLKIFLEEMKNF